MLFHTPAFLALLALTVVLYYAFPRARLWTLAAADMAFYGLPNPAHLPLFLGASLVTYLCSLRARSRHGAWYFTLGLGVNAANLIFFKYALFFTRTFEGALGLPLPAVDSFLVQVVLPVGISFYTFQLAAYLIDVRRGDLAPARSLGEFWVFISLFPQLVAGPIVRGRELLPQLREIAAIRFSRDGFSRGLYLLLGGLAKKVVLADTLAAVVDKLFSQAASLGGLEAWVAAYLFAFQIYFDFSAYSDMAVGIGAMLGIRLPQNFRTPYVSAGPGEFWRRWHVTLSNWIRDYVYVPLGGNRRGLGRQLLNLLVAMAFSGLWHGAAWTFVAWGLYHGLLSVGEKVWNLARERRRRRLWDGVPVRPAAAETAATGTGRAVVGRLARRALAVVFFFHLVVLGWVFFRADGFGTALTMLRNMCSPSTFALTRTAAAGLGLAALLYLLHLAEYAVRRDGRLLGFWTTRVPAPVRGLCYALLAALVMTFVQTEQSSFIYFRF